jgi:CheY-like chemotaxis protein
MRRVLEIGNCDYDHQNIAGLLRRHFEVEVKRAHRDAEALAELARQPYDLVLVNRVFDEDGGDGLTFIRQLKQDPQLRTTAVMLISNYPESQKEAVAAGALPGFGKRALNEPTTVAQLGDVLAS